MDEDRFAALLTAGFSDRLARRRDNSGRYQLANGLGAMLDEQQALTRYEWLIAPTLLQGSSAPDARILLAMPVDIDTLTQKLREYSAANESEKPQLLVSAQQEAYARRLRPFVENAEQVRLRFQTR